MGLWARRVHGAARLWRGRCVAEGIGEDCGERKGKDPTCGSGLAVGEERVCGAVAGLGRAGKRACVGWAGERSAGGLACWAVGARGGKLGRGHGFGPREEWVAG